jgi:hypothetical protein
MKRWSNAFPGAMKVTYSLGNFKADRQAYAAFQQQVLPLVAERPQDQVHPRLRSAGYGKDRKFWGELHFLTAALAEAHIAQHGGDPWYCVGLLAEEGTTGRDTEQTVKEWIKAHTDATAAAHVKTDIIDNSGERLLSDDESPSTYVYVNSADIAVMLKLALGGKV